MAKVYDFVVIGGGSAGNSAAQIARRYNKSVVVIQGSKPGGTCLNLGCIPKKIMWNAASIIEDMKISSGYGIASSYTYDFAYLCNQREAYISNINSGYEEFYREENIDYIQGWARFLDNHTIKVNDLTIVSDNILISTGSKNMVLDIPGKEFLLSSDDFFAMRVLPKKVLIVGNGYIAAELAGLFSSFGIDISMLLRTEQFLSVFDHETANVLRSAMEQSGVKFLTNRRLVNLTKTDEGFVTEYNTGEKAVFDQVYSAIGRVGCIEDMGLENTTIHVKNFFVPSDEWENTNVPGIYSVGDVSSKIQLTPVAIAAGQKLAHRIFGGQADSKLDYANIPTVMFSHPPYGSIGFTEQQARNKHGDDIKIYRTQFNSMFYGLTTHKVPTFLKIITTGPEERIVGLHALGRGVDEMIQGFGVAIKMGATKKDFQSTVGIHPTVSEDLLGLF